MIQMVELVQISVFRLTKKASRFWCFLVFGVSLYIHFLVSVTTEFKLEKFLTVVTTFSVTQVREFSVTWSEQEMSHEEDRYNNNRKSSD